MNAKLAELRKDAGLMQKDLAKALDITQARVSRYEDNGNIPHNLLKSWAYTIGCTVDDLLPDYQPEKGEKIFDFDNGLYGSLTKKLDLLLQYIDEFPHLIEKSSDVSVSPTVKQFRDRVITLNEKPWVVLTGHFDAGKTHLCNFYLGGDRLPTGYSPVTKFPTFIRHIDDRPDWFKADLWLMKPGFLKDPEFAPEKWNDEDYCTKHRRLSGSWDTLQQHATLGDANNNSDEGAVLAFVDAPLLYSCVLVDLPGYDDIVTNVSIIDQLGHCANILLYICRAQGFLGHGDFTRLGHLLRALPWYKEIDDNFPTLGNLFVIASHVHPGITPKQLKNEILGDGSKRFYNHFKGNLLAKLSSRGQSISDKNIRTRFFSFYEEIPPRRKRLEQALKLLLGQQMPLIKERNVEKEILKFKKKGPAIYAKEIDKYEKMLGDIEETKRLYERLVKEEPERKKRHDREVKRIEQEIIAFKDEDLKNLRAVFKKETEVEKLEAMIEKHYKSDKKKAQEQASAYVFEQIQSKAEHFRVPLVDKTSNLIERFVKNYNKEIGKLEDDGIGEYSPKFDTRGAFVGGLAGLSTLGALGAWAATLGNLGGYVIVTKTVGALSALGISFATTGGTAGVTGLVSAIGGPITLALGLAVAVGAFFWRLLGDSWERRLAKKIKNVFEKEESLSKIENKIKSFWDENTLKAFKKGADSLDKQYKNHIKELKDAGNEKKLKVLKKKLEHCEEIKSFFVAIPWR